MAEARLKKYFKFSSMDNNRICGHCQLCDKDYRDKIGIFSNFLKHLKRKYFSEYERLFYKRDESLLEEGITENVSRSTAQLPLKDSKQVYINSAITKYLIVKCNLPLNIVENNEFRDFMKECGIKWELVPAKHLKHNTITRFTEKVNKIIHEILDAVDNVTLTVDGWSDRRCRSFLGVTCHFINSQMQPESYLIDFVRLKSHTSENIHHMAECIVDRFNIREKVYKIVTDNASSMIKAYKFGLIVDDEVNDTDHEFQLMINPDEMLTDDDRKFFRFILKNSILK